MDGNGQVDRERTWPDFREAWIVHDEAAFVVIDKPAGVSSQAADPERPDDIVTRLKRHLSKRGESDYLGVHQRLDKETSGIIVLSRDRRVAPRLATQFEKRTVSKKYLALVSGWPTGRNRVTLRHRIVPDRDGKMRVGSDGQGGAPWAVTHVRLVERRDERALLELELETGRTHQARVQLAHAGAPIAGDGVYGGVPAPRLMLHANRLAFRHPSTDRELCFDSPAPPEFAIWLEKGDLGERVYQDDAAFGCALERAVQRRWQLGRADALPHATSAFRLLNEEADGTPRLAVDVYGSWLVAHLYGSGGPWGDASRRGVVLDRLWTLGFDGVYLKVRPKQANLLVDARREDLAPHVPVRGSPAPDPLLVHEEGVDFLVRLGDGLSTGLFLDQRANRLRVRDWALGRSMANLFAYTCGFTVAAAVGGVTRTVSVDASAVALERGRANLERHQSAGEHSLVVADVTEWLAMAKARGQRFDLVVLDPPSYSTTKRGRFVARTDYTRLAADAMAILNPGGRLLACTNHRGISRARLRRALHEAARLAGRGPARIKDLPGQLDFPEVPWGPAAMKSALATIA
jgi:23S rRNA (cytosine1962-C5)-methyltransferase